MRGTLKDDATPGQVIAAVFPGGTITGCPKVRCMQIIAELEGEGMVLREQGSTTRKALDDALTKAGVIPRVVMEIGSREAIREAVIKGVGIGAVSEIEYIPDPAIRMVRVSDAEMYTHAHVVCLKERRGARLVKAFLEIVAELQRGRAHPRRSSELPHS